MLQNGKCAWEAKTGYVKRKTKEFLDVYINSGVGEIKGRHIIDLE
jgi:hypothetical protein